PFIVVDSYKNWLQIQQQRKSSLRAACDKYNLSTSSNYENVFTGQLLVEHTHKFIVCEVPKVGCSNWRRVILTLMNISIEDLALKNKSIHKHNLLKKVQQYPREQQKEILKSYTKVMFTRNPLERLVSAYRDKFLHSSYYYGTVVANSIKKRYRNNTKMAENVSFREFVQFLLDTHNMDVHWNQMIKLCDPCNIQYDFLGRYDTIERDADNILRFIGAPEDIRYPDIKNHATENRTNLTLTEEFLRNLTRKQIDGLYTLYKKDFLLFNYPVYNQI
uniref:Carbohydrate sulfotransferase n=1 Tax=Latimeria chalumnae TaxID=7897 RepID=H2ZVB9_LATCH